MGELAKRRGELARRLGIEDDLRPALRALSRQEVQWEAYRPSPGRRPRGHEEAYVQLRPEGKGRHSGLLLSGAVRRQLGVADRTPVVVEWSPQLRRFCLRAVTEPYDRRRHLLFRQRDFGGGALTRWLMEHGMQRGVRYPAHVEKGRVEWSVEVPEPGSHSGG